MRKVVILGAGISGLAAADRLLEIGGHDVTLAEARPHVGGLAATVRRDGFATDLGPHRLYSELPEARAYWSELLGDRLIKVRRSSRMFLAGRWVDYPLRPAQLARALGALKAARIAASLAAAKLSAPFAFGRDDNFERVMMRAFGSAAYRLALEPYTRKIWRTDPAELSAEIARLRLPDRGLVAAFARLLRPGSRGAPLREFEYVRGGIGGVADAMAERVKQRGGRILLQSRITGIKFGMTGATAVEIDGPNGRAALDADVVLSTLPIPTLGAMLPGGDIDGRAAIASLEYLALVLVVLTLAKERVGNDQWLYFPEEPPRISRASEPKNFDPSMAPRARTALCCEMTCRKSEPLWKAPDGAITSQVERELQDIGLISKGDVKACLIIKENWGYPIYRLGFEKELEKIWPFFARIPNLLSVGRQGLYNHNNIDHCIVMGRRAAETAAQSRKPAQEWYSNLSQFAKFRIVD